MNFNCLRIAMSYCRCLIVIVHWNCALITGSVMRPVDNETATFALWHSQKSISSAFNTLKKKSLANVEHKKVAKTRQILLCLRRRSHESLMEMCKCRLTDGMRKKFDGSLHGYMFQASRDQHIMCKTLKYFFVSQKKLYN